MCAFMSKENRPVPASGGFVPSEKTDNHKTNPQAAIPHASGEFDPVSNTYITATATEDIIYAVARRFDVTVKDLMIENGLEQPVIHAGQKLHIPVKDVNEDFLSADPENEKTEKIAGGGDDDDKELLQIKSYLDTRDEYKNDPVKRDSKALEIQTMLGNIRKNLKHKKLDKKTWEKEDRKNYDDELLRVFGQMLAANPAYYLAKESELETEVLFRTTLIMNARRSTDRGCRYGSPVSGEMDKDAHLDDRYWNQIGQRQFIPKAGTSSSAAVGSIFNPGTELECDTMLTSNVYRTMLDIMGPEDFNERFDQTGNLEISDTRFSSKDGGQLLKQGFMEVVKISSFEELIPGDWVYFVNIPLYGTVAFWNGGAYTGENAVFEGFTSGNSGEKNNAMFSGFGLENSSFDIIAKHMKIDFKAQAMGWAEIRNNPSEEPEKSDGIKNKKLIAILVALPLMGKETRYLDQYSEMSDVELLSGDGAKVKLFNQEVTIANIFEPTFKNEHLPFMDIASPFMRTMEDSFPGISILVKRPVISKIAGK